MLELGSNYTLGSYRIFLGSRAIRALAERLERGELGPRDVAWQLKCAALTRLDNAKFLRSNFPQSEAIVRASEHLEEAARLYEEALHLINASSKVAELLREAAQHEAEAGELMIAASRA